MTIPTILYVAGYGRSGSTLLDRLLASRADTFGGGELVNLLPMLMQHDAAPDPEWEALFDRIRSRIDVPLAAALQERIEHLRPSGWRTFMADYGTASAEDYAVLSRSLWEVVAEEAGPSARFIVDSSKTTRHSFFRPMALRAAAGFDVRVIHLVRDGRGCTWSNLKGSNRSLEAGRAVQPRWVVSRTAASWVLANAGAHVFARRFPESYRRVRYEDLVDTPAATIATLREFLGVDLTAQGEMLAGRRPVPRGRQLMGNRLRTLPDIVVRKDEEWRRRLSWKQSMLFWTIGGSLARHYGYRR